VAAFGELAHCEQRIESSSRGEAHDGIVAEELFAISGRVQVAAS
jgi:hypothetical protein